MASPKSLASAMPSETASNANGDIQHKSPKMNGLRVLVVGAGIAGLSVATGLRKQGHQVEIFEQSQFAREAGAAVHIAPNAHGLLKRLGIDMDQLEANKMERLTEFDANGTLRRSFDVNGGSQIWQHEWRLAHRAQLHESLKQAATADFGRGDPAILHLRSPVSRVDSLQATVTLVDGRVIQGDVVLAADGVYSVCRAQVPGGHVQASSSGKSAFRFMIDRSSALNDPVTKGFAEKPGELIIWYAADRRIVMYPTCNNRLMNFVCIHPELESAAQDDWTTHTTTQALVNVYKEFDPACVALISKASPSSLKAWRLLDMPPLPTWISGSMALLGDAAHPFLPHQGQGAAVAIEDAAALSVVLESGLSKEEVPARLRLYQQIRMERAHRIQEYSRLAGKDSHSQSPQFDMTEYTNYNFGHDEFDYSTQRLREWKWAQTPDVYWRMPIAFGPMPGPRQSHTGIVRNAVASTFCTASVKFKTSRTVLQNLFPPGIKNYRFTSPGTFAYCSYSCTTLDKMEWLGGSGYSHVGLYIHGVEYEKANGEVIKGTYMPILFESLTDPIVSGREELGMPKLYTSIDIYRGAESYRINTGWQGSMWGSFQLHDLKRSANLTAATGKVSGEDDDAILVYRYLPQVGRSNKGQSEAQYPVFVPFAEEIPQPVTETVWEASSATINIDALGWDALPTLHHVVQRLQEIPVYETVSAKIVEGRGVPDVGAARRIE